MYVNGHLPGARNLRYYFETLHKQSFGANHLSVGWIMPDGAQEGPIPGSRLSPAVSSGMPVATSSTFGTTMQKLPLSGAIRLAIKATPNPSTGPFTITTVSNSNEPVDMILLDMAGRVIEKRTCIAINRTIQLGNRVQAGVYVLEVRQDEQKEIIKLIRQ